MSQISYKDLGALQVNPDGPDALLTSYGDLGALHVEPGAEPPPGFKPHFADGTVFHEGRALC